MPQSNSNVHPIFGNILDSLFPPPITETQSATVNPFDVQDRIAAQELHRKMCAYRPSSIFITAYSTEEEGVYALAKAQCQDYGYPMCLTEFYKGKTLEQVRLSDPF